MLESMVSSLGMPTFVLIIVGVALLIVVLLLMSYFNVLLAIAHFTYPNAKFRGQGNPFIKEKELSPLVESRNINEVFSEVKNKGFDISKESREDIDQVEREIEKNNLELIKKAKRASPYETKPLVDAWLTRYDVKMAKKAIKSVRKGGEKEEIKTKLMPVKMIDESIIESMASARNMQELISVLKETELEEVLAGEDWGEDFFQLDVELDKFAFDRLKKSVMKVDTQERSPVKLFIGKYIDIYNLKIIVRGINEGIDNDTLKECLLPDGWELKRWKLEQMVESKNLEEALVELEGTDYAELRKEGTAKGLFEIEMMLDSILLSVSSKLMSENVLRVGPVLKYLVSKELESRNLRVLIRGIKEGVSPERIKGMMIMEDYR